jgi:hypothetical protein
MNDVIDTNAGSDGGDGSGAGAAWLSSVPENLRTNEAFKGIEKSSDAWQQFVDMKVKSKDALYIPGETATDAEKSAFYSKLGRPKTAEDYTITQPANYPIEYDKNTESVFRSAFYEAGLSDESANKLWGKYHELVAQGHETSQKAEKEAHDAAVNALKDEWTGDKFKVNTEIASRAFSGIFDDAAKQGEAKKFIEETKVNGLPLGNHPMFLKVFHQIGSIIGDDKINHGRDGSLESGMSDEERAQKRFPNTKFKK